MSLRNVNSNIALSKLNELFMLHKYDECVLLINRLNHITLNSLVSQLPVDSFLARLPYTLEIFEALYSKIFIIDPECFPNRNLMPERLLDKMVSYFSLLADEDKLEPVDGIKILDSLENVIRVISYIQPNLYSKLLYFKQAIDNGLNKLTKDSHANDTLLSNVWCDQLKHELQETIWKCEKAQNKLSHYSNEVKSKKLFKDAQLNGKNRLDPIDQQCSTSFCQSFIQTRLFLNKSLMNSIEHHLNSIRIQHILQNINEKIELDKEILLVYSNIKHEEKHLRANEPLLPLLKRYSLGYERIIQIWRKKCSADNLALPTSTSHFSFKKSLYDLDSLLIDEDSNDDLKNTNIRILEKKRCSNSQSDNNILCESESRRQSSGIPVRIKKQGVRLVGLCEEDKNANLESSELEKLKRELNQAKELIRKLRRNDESVHRRSHSSDELIDTNSRVNKSKSNVKYDVIELYESYYRKNYLNTLNSLDSLENLKDFKIKLLFSIVVLSFHNVDLYIKEITKNLRALLQIDTNKHTTQSYTNDNSKSGTMSRNDKRLSNDFMESSLNHYLRTTCKTFDLSCLSESIREQLWTTMCEHPSLKESECLMRFIDDSLRLAWILTLQEPTLKIDYSTFKYDNSRHECFENCSQTNSTTNASNQQHKIVQYLWPMLVNKLSLKCNKTLFTYRIILEIFFQQQKKLCKLDDNHDD